MANQLPTYVSGKAAAQMLACDYRTFRRFVRERNVPYLNVGSEARPKYRYRVSDIEALLAPHSPPLSRPKKLPRITAKPAR